MGLATNMIILYFCMLFALYLADPDMSTGFLDFLEGTYAIDINTLLTLSISTLVGIVASILARDVMTGVISTIAIAMGSWFVVPTDFMHGAPVEIRLFVTGVMTIIWGMAIIGFFRGYEP